MWEVAVSISFIFILELLPQCECCFPLGHVEIDVFGHMHSDGGAHYFIYGFPLGCDRSRFFTMANGCDLSSDDQHILHHLFPQVKVFAVKFLSQLILQLYLATFTMFLQQTLYSININKFIIHFFLLYAILKIMLFLHLPEYNRFIFN